MSQASQPRTSVSSDSDLGTAPMPKERYTSPEFMRLEWERMSTRTWLLAGREGDVANPGDYFTFEIGPESLLVVRDRAGRIGAHYYVMSVCTVGTDSARPG